MQNLVKLAEYNIIIYINIMRNDIICMLVYMRHVTSYFDK